MKPARIEQFKSVLESLRSRLRDEVDDRAETVATSARLAGESDSPTHLADFASETLDTEITLLHSEGEALREVDAALDRIAAGQFGVCENCGGEIADQRLKALPYARHCIECARQMQQPAGS